MIGKYSILVFALSLSWASAGSDLRMTRFDENVPQKCRGAGLDQLAHGPIKMITYSIDGAKKRGFTHEYELSRSGATLLYKAFRNRGEGREDRRLMRRIRSDRRTHDAYTKLVYAEKDFELSYKTEGEILEALALLELYESLGPDYFVTGGITYFSGHRTVGEIDIWIGDRSTCQIVAIGEAKLSIRNLRKAKEQLRRFRSYVKKHQVRQSLPESVFEWSGRAKMRWTANGPH